MAEETKEVEINDLKNLLVELTRKAFIESFDKGSRKYGDRWKTTSWTGIKGLADSKWDMFLNLIDNDDKSEIEHHASDMIAWITILSVRAMNDLRSDHARETVIIESRDFSEHNKLMTEIAIQMSTGKRVVIE